MMPDAQEQALRTNSIKFSLNKTADIHLCRLCWISTEVIGHISSGCSKLTQKYKKKHNKVALRVH